MPYRNPNLETNDHTDTYNGQRGSLSAGAVQAGYNAKTGGGNSNPYLNIVNTLGTRPSVQDPTRPAYPRRDGKQPTPGGPLPTPYPGIPGGSRGQGLGDGTLGLYGGSGGGALPVPAFPGIPGGPRTAGYGDGTLGLYGGGGALPSPAFPGTPGGPRTEGYGDGSLGLYSGMVPRPGYGVPVPPLPPTVTAGGPRTAGYGDGSLGLYGGGGPKDDPVVTDPTVTDPTITDPPVTDSPTTTTPKRRRPIDGGPRGVKNNPWYDLGLVDVNGNTLYDKVADYYADTYNMPWMKGKASIAKQYHAWAYDPNVSDEERKQRQAMPFDKWVRWTGTDSYSRGSGDPEKTGLNNLYQGPIRNYDTGQPPTTTDDGSGSTTVTTTYSEKPKGDYTGSGDEYLKRRQAAIEAYYNNLRTEGERQLRARGAITGMQNSGGFGDVLGDYYRDSILAQGREGSAAMFEHSENEQERLLKDALARIASGDSRYAADRAASSSLGAARFGANASMYNARLGADSDLMRAYLGLMGQMYGLTPSLLDQIWGSSGSNWLFRQNPILGSLFMR